ncbi:4-hydroxyphenylacetate 3-hydroxylase [Aureococcus anophagefferens]|nr:4-hydroxyphenylacetate 3-hydroxylase [Aureococcus anophagefferens]
MNGVAKASHIKDKLIEMTHLNETIFGMGIAASMSAKPTPAGNYEPDVLLANICKHHATRFLRERASPRTSRGRRRDHALRRRLQQRGDRRSLKYLCAGAGGPTTRVLRLIENMTMGRNAVGYLAESMHGAGSPAAQRVLIRSSARSRSAATAIAGCGGACSGLVGLFLSF